MKVRFQADADLIRVVVDDLLLIWETSDAEEWINQIQSLPL